MLTGRRLSFTHCIGRSDLSKTTSTLQLCQNWALAKPVFDHNLVEFGEGWRAALQVGRQGRTPGLGPPVATCARLPIHGRHVDTHFQGWRAASCRFTDPHQPSTILARLHTGSLA
jgi:hypothetical protein